MCNPIPSGEADLPRARRTRGAAADDADIGDEVRLRGKVMEIDSGHRATRGPLAPRAISLGCFVEFIVGSRNQQVLADATPARTFERVVLATFRASLGRNQDTKTCRQSLRISNFHPA
jgi:hypothetical protein